MAQDDVKVNSQETYIRLKDENQLFKWSQENTIKPDIAEVKAGDALLVGVPSTET